MTHAGSTSGCILSVSAEDVSIRPDTSSFLAVPNKDRHGEAEQLKTITDVSPVGTHQIHGLHILSSLYQITYPFVKEENWVVHN